MRSFFSAAKKVLQASWRYTRSNWRYLKFSYSKLLASANKLLAFARGKNIHLRKKVAKMTIVLMKKWNH